MVMEVAMEMAMEMAMAMVMIVMESGIDMETKIILQIRGNTSK